MAGLSLDEWSLTIGVIVAPFGLAGEMKVKLETDFPERFERLKQVCVRDVAGGGTIMRLTGARHHKGQVLMKLQGVNSIDDAEKLRNSLVQVRGEDAVQLPSNEYYIHDLVGCDVVTDSGRALGSVSSILRAGLANDVLVIGEGKQEILLPMVHDVVRRVNISARQIVVSPTPGLLPDEQGEA